MINPVWLGEGDTSSVCVRQCGNGREARQGRKPERQQMSEAGDEMCEKLF